MAAFRALLRSAELPSLAQTRIAQSAICSVDHKRCWGHCLAEELPPALVSAPCALATMAACAPARAADLVRAAAQQRGGRQPAAAAAAPIAPTAAAALRRRRPGAPQQPRRALPPTRSGSAEAAQATAAPPAAAVPGGEVKAVLFDMVRLLGFGGSLPSVWRVLQRVI